MVLLDGDGLAAGECGLVEAHLAPGRKHLAFTLVLVDPDGLVVLARRAATKPLWPGAFDGTVASHPLAGESTARAAVRRAGEELGLAPEDLVHGPTVVGAVDYRVDDPGSRAPALAENERCDVLVAGLAPDAVLAPDPQEVDGLRRVTVPALLAAAPAVWRTHCPWLALALEVVRRAHGRLPRPLADGFAALLRPEAERDLARASGLLLPGGEWRVVPPFGEAERGGGL